MPSRNGRSAKRRPKRRAIIKSPPLTERELEVAEWIAAGKRDREIGEILGCSFRTVHKHVQHIFEKIHVETRTAVCVWWYERRPDGDKSPHRPRRK